jgi:hypothetical protein
MCSHCRDQFTESVVTAIVPQLELAEIERLRHKPTVHLDAYDLLLRVHQLEYEYSPDSLAAAMERVKSERLPSIRRMHRQWRRVPIAVPNGATNAGRSKSPRSRPTSPAPGPGQS